MTLKNWFYEWLDFGVKNKATDVLFRIRLQLFAYVVYGFFKLSLCLIWLCSACNKPYVTI